MAEAEVQEQDADIGGIAAGRLEERKVLAGDNRDIFVEAKSAGFN
ncbi:MAG TPA: hypothetical protein VIL69_05320 [Roseomonas sp.]|jgi:hypothetical protein